jgi:hypothetical protein
VICVSDVAGFAFYSLPYVVAHGNMSIWSGSRSCDRLSG